MKTTKRLFSWLIVLAMVFAMVPVFELPAFAATEVEEEAPAAVRFPSDVEVYEAECPVCKTTVTWKPYNGENYSEDTVLTGEAHYHLYLAEDKTYEVGKSFLISWRKVCFNLNGYNITAVEGSKSTFGVTQVLNLIDTFGGSVVTGYSNGTGSGAALHINGGKASATYNLYGGTYKKLASDTMSSIVKIAYNGGTVNLYDGAVIDATDTEVKNNVTGAAVGLTGNVTTTTDAEGKETSTTYYATFNMYGGEIKGGIGISGGAVQVGSYHASNRDCAVFNMKGGKISGGVAQDLLNEDGSVKATGAGGNFSVHYGATLNISGGIIAGGHVVGNTEGSQWGGNIRAWSGTVNISGGLIYGGTGGRNQTGANVSVFSDDAGRTAGYGVLTISGGTIVGDVATTQSNSETVKLSGAPKIVTSMEIDGETVNAVTGGLWLKNGSDIDVSKLSADADIVVSNVTAGQFFTAADANAAKVAGCFKSADGKLQGKVEGDKIYLTDKPVVGGANLPAAAAAKIAAAAKVNNSDAAIDGYIAAKTCPMCGATNVTWTKGDAVIPNSNKVSDTKKHYYFDAEKTTTSNFVQMVKLDGVDSANNTICVALKSTANITCTKYRVQIGGTGNTLNIMGTGTLQADQRNSDVGDLGLFQLDSGTLNLYGGTFLHAHKGLDAKYAVVRIGSASVTVNIYKDATIGPAELDRTQPATNVFFNSKGTLNIYGGTIRHGVSFRGSSSGNIDNNAGGTINMYGGTILGGAPMVDAEGKVVKVNGTEINDTKANVRCMGGSFNMYGGVIDGGLSKNGGNGAGVFGSGGAVLNILGGTIKNGESTSYGGNLGGWTATINIGGTALIENGIVTNGGANLYIPNAALKVNMTGGTIRGGEAKLGGNIYLVANTNGGYLNISGGVIEGGKATNEKEGGGNIFAAKGAALTITGGTIRDGESAGYAGNLMYHNDITLEGNIVISGGKAKNGGNIRVSNGYTLTVGKDVQILDGEATEEGGNIHAGTATIVNNGTIKGGVAGISGGNIHRDEAGITTNNGIIADGKAQQFGGNISQPTGGEYVQNEGAVLANGTITKATAGSHWGGNIRSWNGKITINGGLVYGGNGAISNVDANNIGALGDNPNYVPELTINGGTIVGDIATSAVVKKLNEETKEEEITFPGTKVTITGAPKIVKSLEIDGETVEATVCGLRLSNGVEADISGLSSEAEIAISASAAGNAFTAAYENAATLKDVFVPFDDNRYFIELGEDNVFYCISGEVAIMASEEEATWYKTAEEAVAAYYADGAFAKNLYLRVGTNDVTLTLAGDAYLNLGGYDVTVAGTGTVYGFDYTNDDYNGYTLLTVAEGAEIEIAPETKILKNRYITVPENGKYGFHRLAMWLSDVTLRTSNPGMYYKAAYQCDSVLAGLVDSYGVALSLNAVPGLDFAEASGVKYTQYGNEDFAANRNGSLVNTNSGAVVGILKDKNSQATNTENLSRVIYANAYITFTMEGGATHTVISDSLNAGKTVEDEGFKGTGLSLYDILLKVNENWADYSAEDQATVVAFLEQWAPKVEAATAAELMGKLTNIVK